jgi:hypothetical protein
MFALPCVVSTATAKRNESGEEFFMKISAVIGTSSLFLLLGIAAPTHAQDQHPQDQPAEKSKEPEKSKDQPAEKAKDPKAPHDAPTRQDNAPPKNPNEQPHPNDTKAPPRDQNNGTARNGDASRTVDAGRNGQKGDARGGGKRIPDEKFKASFGREHRFHVGHPQVVEGHPRFSYGGYSFIIVNAWPNGWGYDDDVYVIDVDGVYYLVDDAHPGVQVSLELVL